MTILEMVAETMSHQEIGTVLHRKEIIKMVRDRYDVNPSSIIPSDYCYNMTNKDKQTNSSLKKFNIFLNVGRGLYQYVGSNYTRAK